MAQTHLRKYAVIERLGKMDVDLIDVTLVCDTGSIADNQVISTYVEIPNIASVDGGAGLIHSILLLDEGDLGGAVDLVFQTDNTTIGDINEDIGLSDADARDIIGYVSMTTYFDGLDWQMSTKTNIGMTYKCASSTKSLYVACINRSGGALDYNLAGDLKLRIGVIKD